VEQAYADFPAADTVALASLVPILERHVRVWPGLMAEWERLGPAAFTSKGYPEHRLSLILDSSGNVTRRESGRANDLPIRTGQVVLAPAFRPTTYEWSNELEVMSLVFTPDWLRAVATEIGVRQPNHLELYPSANLQDEFLASLLRTFQSEVLNPQIGSQLLID
jgi:AraC family transcriptional regulator